MRSYFLIVVLLLALTLTACGGGGVSPSPAPSVVATVIPAPSSSPSPSPELLESPETEVSPSPAAVVETSELENVGRGFQDAPPDVTVSKSETRQVTEPAPSVVANTVKYSVFDGEKYIIPVCDVTIADGESVFDVLKRLTRDGGIQMEFKGGGGMEYVEGINNLYEFDCGAQSGWIYYINGEFMSVSSGSYKLKPGDEVKWEYITKRVY